MLDLTYLAPAIQDPPLQPYDEFSRYRGLPILTTTDTQGRDIVYVARRILPQPESLGQFGQTAVRAGDRLDIIAFQQFGDARWWWRLADANRALDPADLTAVPGKQLRITLPAGVPLPRQT
jgi:hypothetical protein